MASDRERKKWGTISVAISPTMSRPKSASQRNTKKGRPERSSAARTSCSTRDSGKASTLACTSSMASTSYNFV